MYVCKLSQPTGLCQSEITVPSQLSPNDTVLYVILALISSTLQYKNSAAHIPMSSTCEDDDCLAGASTYCMYLATNCIFMTL